MYEMNNDMIDMDKLRSDMENDSLGAFFGGGYGAGLVSASDIECASDDELIEMAQRNNVGLDKYR